MGFSESDSVSLPNSNNASLINDQVKKVNRVEIDNLEHLCKLVENCSEPNLRFDFEDDRVIVLDYSLAKQATSRILKRHRIPSAMSVDLTDEHDGTKFEMAAA